MPQHMVGVQRNIPLPGIPDDLPDMPVQPDGGLELGFRQISVSSFVFDGNGI
ncbi:hypothetical protein D3C71_1980400 [compost metagenome]